MKQASLLDDWELPEPDVMPRSRLYDQPILGQGTVMQEALVSYLIRLSNAHSLAPLVLINREVIPLTEIRFEKSSSSFTSKYAKTINSYQKYAKEFAAALYQLTCQSEVNRGTFISWGDVLDPKGSKIMHDHPHWCSDCLNDWRINGETPYFPLMWYSRPVKHCLKHGKALVDVCPRCGEHQPFIPKHYYIDHCSLCGGWLGALLNSNEEGDASSFSKYETFSAEAVAEMITEGGEVHEYAKYEVLQEKLKGYANLISGGNYADFERKVGFRKTVLSQWINKDTRPQIDQLLLLCFRLGTTPVRLLRESLPTEMPSIMRPFPTHVARKKISLTAKQRKKLLEDLQEIIDAESEPITLKEACSKLGYTKNFLRYWFPEECQAISEKRKEYVRVMSKEHKEQARALAYKVVFELLSEKVRFNSKDVEQILKPLGLSQLNPIVRAGIKQAKRDYFADMNRSAGR